MAKADRKQPLPFAFSCQSCTAYGFTNDSETLVNGLGSISASCHDFENADWEAHAMFWNGLRSGKTENEVLDWMHETFNVTYPKRGMLFALGNMAKRPQTWQLLGVIRADEPLQGWICRLIRHRQRRPCERADWIAADGGKHLLTGIKVGPLLHML